MIATLSITILAIAAGYAFGRSHGADLLARYRTRELEAVDWAMACEDLIAHPGALLNARKRSKPKVEEAFAREARERAEREVAHG